MKTRLSLLSAATLAMLAALNCASAGTPSKNDVKAAATIKEKLTARFPDARIVSVQASEFPGLYEVFTGDTMSYSDATGERIFVGSFIETKTKRNLTNERVDTLNTVDFSALPLDRAIKVVKGNGRRQVAVFTDPECPFCQQLEKEFASVTDVTIYNFLFPIASLHPDAPARAQALWCAPDPGTAWKEWMVDRKPPAWKTCEGHPVDELQALGEKLRITSTPMIFASNGRRFSGAMPLAELEKFLDGTKSAAAARAGDAPKGTPTASRD